MSEPEEVLPIDAEESSDDNTKDEIDLNNESVDQINEVLSEDSSESEDIDEDFKQEK